MGRVVNEWRFDVVRLWERDAADMLALGPGGAVLVGLVDRGDLRLIGRASRQISRQDPRRQQPNLFAILQDLCGQRYTAEQLARVIPKEVVMASSLYKEMREWAHEKGLEKGRLADARLLCSSFVKRHHAAVAPRVLPAVEACTSIARLHQWALRAPEVSSDEFVQLVRKATSGRTTRRRAPRPAPRSKRPAAR
jgi:hypothetical protein